MTMTLIVSANRYKRWRALDPSLNASSRGRIASLRFEALALIDLSCEKAAAIAPAASVLSMMYVMLMMAIFEMVLFKVVVMMSGRDSGTDFVADFIDGHPRVSSPNVRAGLDI